MWRFLYSPLGNKVGDLQWIILHSAVAVNYFVHVTSSNVCNLCPFCGTKETSFFIVLWSVHDCAIYLIFSHCCLVS